MAISGLNFRMILRADLMRSVTKPRRMSVLGRFLCPIDSPLSLSWWCRLVFEIKFDFPIFESWKVGWIDDNFVGIIVFSYNVNCPN